MYNLTRLAACVSLIDGWAFVPQSTFHVFSLLLSDPGSNSFWLYALVGLMCSALHM